jgi:NitT/TauT family transport system ATP-binding protein
MMGSPMVAMEAEFAVKTPSPAAPSPRMPDVIEVAGVGKRFQSRSGKSTSVFEGVSLSVRRGEFVLLLGPSGCGKSTLLNMIAGFEPPSEGRILQDGAPVVHPDARRTMVFQDVQGSLFPWLSAQANVEFGLRMAGMPGPDRAAAASKYLQLVSLGHAAGKMPFELSGGMKQRVQIARALAMNPEVLLMDEPFGALDAQSRNVLQAELERIWRETKKTIIFVTHDIMEAVRLADRIVVFGNGPAAKIVKIIEVDLPRPRLPTCLEVARLAQEIGALFSRFTVHAHEGTA